MTAGADRIHRGVLARPVRVEREEVSRNTGTVRRARAVVVRVGMARRRGVDPATRGGVGPAARRGVGPARAATVIPRVGPVSGARANRTVSEANANHTVSVHRAPEPVVHLGMARPPRPAQARAETGTHRAVAPVRAAMIATAGVDKKLLNVR